MKILIPISLGLCNRILLLQRIDKFQREGGKHIKIYWVKSSFCGICHSKLFALKNPSLELITISDSDYHPLLNKNLSMHPPKGAKISNLRLLDILDFNQEIVKKAKTFHEKNLKNKGAQGVHIRWPLDIGPWGKKLPTLSHYAPFFKGGGLNFIATNGPPVFKELQSLYPAVQFLKQDVQLGKQVKGKMHNVSRSSEAGMMGGLVDLLLLSSCDKLIKSPGSTFSNVAGTLRRDPRNPMFS